MLACYGPLSTDARVSDPENINPYTGKRGTKSPTWNDRPPSSGSNTNPYGTLNLYDTPNPYGTGNFKY